MIKCQYYNCNKEYKKANYWYQHHLLIKHGLATKVPLSYWIINILIALIIGVLIYFIFSAEPSLYEILIGPKLRVDFYDELKEIDNKTSIIIDLTNEGGIDLHNVKAQLNVSCYDGYNKAQVYYGPETFEKPSYHIIADSEPKQIYFRNEELIKRLKNQKNVNCADSLFLIFIFSVINETSTGLDRILVFKYLEDYKSLTLETIDDYKKFNESLCWYCDYMLKVDSDEKSFIIPPKRKPHSLTGIVINSAPGPNPPFPGKTYLDYRYYGNGRISCIPCVINQLDKDFPDLKIKENWDLTENSLTISSWSKYESTKQQSC